jgi:hypothetical protein
MSRSLYRNIDPNNQFQFPSSAQITGALIVGASPNRQVLPGDVWAQSATCEYPLFFLDLYNYTPNVDRMRFRQENTATGNTTEVNLYDDAHVTYPGEIHCITNDEIRMRFTLDGSTVIGNPTGGGKGFGTINVENGVFDDGVQLTDYVLEQYFGAPITDPKRQDYVRPTLKEALHLARTEFRLHALPSRAEWEKQRLSMGELAQRLWQTCEEQFTYIIELDKACKALERYVSEAEAV